jgi:hypothetical protein
MIVNTGLVKRLPQLGQVTGTDWAPEAMVAEFTVWVLSMLYDAWRTGSDLAIAADRMPSNRQYHGLYGRTPKPAPVLAHGGASLGQKGRSVKFGSDLRQVGRANG